MATLKEYNNEDLLDKIRLKSQKFYKKEKNYLFKNVRVYHSVKYSPSIFFDKYSQQSIIKVSYLTNKHNYQWKVHGKYLEREGGQNVNERGCGFDESNHKVSISDALNEWQKNGDEILYKIIISPEKGSEINLKAHTIELVKSMEKDLKYKFNWVAIDHYNTDNPHVHLVIRGVDQNKTKVCIPRDYISSGIRVRSKELATKELGLRTDNDISLQRKRMIEQKRFNYLDKEIIEISNANIITLSNLNEKCNKQTKLNLLGRLQYLEQNGFVKQSKKKEWILNKDLKHALDQYQLSSDIVKAKYKHRNFIKNPNLPFVYTTLDTNQFVEGRVIGSGLHNEDSDNRYILLEGVDQKIHYIRTTNNVNKQKDNMQLKDGDNIRIECKEFSNKKGQLIKYLRVGRANISNRKNWGDM